MAISKHLSAVFGGIGRALVSRAYRRFWIGNAISTTGRWMHRMAVGWLTWELTESTSWLGVIAFADAFPMVVFSIIAGAIADRIGYMRTMRITQLATGCVGAVLAALTLSGLVTMELVLILTVCFGSLDALSAPPRMSVVHSLVPKQDLSAAIALGSTTFNGARVLGPAIAGALILWISIGAVIALAAATFFLFLFVLFGIHFDEAGRDKKLSFDLAYDIKDGIQYVFNHPGIRFLMIILGLTGLLIRPCIELLPGFAAQVFGRGPEGLALLMSSIGLGAMCSGLWLAWRGRTTGLTRLVAMSLMTTAVSLFLFSVIPYISLASLFLVLMGYSMLIGGIGSQTLIQNAVDSAMRARVMSLFVAISWGLPAIGALAMGWIASFLGLQPTIAGGAVLALIFWLWARRIWKQLASDLEKID